MLPTSLPPEAQAFLERYRVRLRRRRPTGEAGPHDVRRRGDSLDFREHVPYRPGDDTRHVDWRRSLRPTRPGVLPTDEWLVRRFEAEEQLRLVISVDTRPTMSLPEPFAKLQAAYWLAEAVAAVALRDNDQVVIHRLFGQAARRSPRLRGRGARAQLPGVLAEVLRPVDDPDAPLNVAGLTPYLPPASVWVIISDLYAHSTALGDLVGHCRAAMGGRRLVLLFEMDSWPNERALLAGRLWKVSPTPQADGLELMADPATLGDIERRIADHKRPLAELAHTPLFRHERWELPIGSSPTDHAFAWFQQRLVASNALGQLFAGDRW